MTMSIGEFAAHVGLSVKTLRFYDQCDLLPAQEVDPATGYRRYGVHQLRVANLVRALRAAGVPIDDVARMVAEPDRAAHLLSRHEERVRAERALADRAAVVAGSLLADADQPFTVHTRRAEPTHWVAAVVTVDIEHDDADTNEEWADDLVDELRDALTAQGNPPTGAWWTSIDAGGTTQVRTFLTWPVAHPLPSHLSLDGVHVATGTLPARTEAYVRADVSSIARDLLDDSPGGRLLHPAYIALAEHLEAESTAPAQIRQSPILDADGTPIAMELTATVTA